MEKSADAFRTITEVAEDLDLPTHVLRFWETRFTQIKPLKRGGGRRYYRPEDVDLLRAIRRLLHDEGYTIKGVQRILKEYGVRAVAQMALAEMTPEATGESVEPLARHGARAGAQPDFTPSEEASAPEPSALLRTSRPAPSAAAPANPRGDDGPTRLALLQLDAARDALRPAHEAALGASQRRPASSESAPPHVEPPRHAQPHIDASSPLRPTIEAQGLILRAQDVERLKAALYELAECERLLAAARES